MLARHFTFFDDPGNLAFATSLANELAKSEVIVKDITIK